MKLKLLVLASCIVVTMLLTGCFKSGSGSGSGSGSSSSTSGVSANYGGSGSGDSGSSSYSGSSSTVLQHNPEPATIALVGTGLAAYLFMKTRKKNNKK